MKKAEHVWVVVTDGAQARFLMPNRKVSRLLPAGPADLASPDAKARASGLKSDRPGRTFSSSRSGQRHAIEPKHDHHKLEKHKLSASVVAVLDRARSKRDFEDLIIVAPRRSIGEIRALLSDRVRDCLREEVAKDLTKSSEDQLLSRLKPAIERILVGLPTPGGVDLPQ
jgi:protein required for attachment to host cells